MRKRTESSGDMTDKRLFSQPDLQFYVSLGYASARTLAEEAGAVVRIGKRVLYDREKIDQYISTMMIRK